MRRSGFTGSQDVIANDQDCVDFGQACADIYKALERGMGGKKLEDLSRTMGDAIKQLTTRVPHAVKDSRSPTDHSPDPSAFAETQEKVTKRSGRHMFQFVVKL